MGMIKFISAVLKKLTALVVGSIASMMAEIIAILQLVVWWIRLSISVMKVCREYASMPVDMKVS